MKRILLVAVLIMSTALAWAVTSHSRSGIDYKVSPGELAESEGAYAWTLLDFVDWFNERPMAQDLTPTWVMGLQLGDTSVQIPEWLSKKDKEEKLEVFEAKGAFLLPQPPSYYNQDKVLNEKVIRDFDPENEHKVTVKGQKVHIVTRAEFPWLFRKAITYGKKFEFVKKSQDTYVEMKSDWRFISSDQMQKVPALQDIAQGVADDFGLQQMKPEVMIFQDVYGFNQIGQFGRSLLVLVPVGQDKSLALVMTVMGVEKDVLSYGFPFMGKDLTGRGVLRGESFLNTDSGFGAGLPKYMQALMEAMAETLGRL